MFGVKTQTAITFSVSPIILSPISSDSWSDSDSLNVSARSAVSNSEPTSPRVFTPPPTPVAAIGAPVVLRPIPTKAVPAATPAIVTMSPQTASNQSSPNGSPVSPNGSPPSDHKTLAAHKFFQPPKDEKFLALDVMSLHTQLGDEIKMCELLITKNYTLDHGILTHFSTAEIESFLVKYKAQLAIDDTEQKQLSDNLKALNAIGQKFRAFEKKFGFEWFKKFRNEILPDFQLLNQYREELVLLVDEEASAKRNKIAQLEIKLQKILGVRDKYSDNIDNNKEFTSLEAARNTNVQQFRATIAGHVGQLKMLRATLKQQFTVTDVSVESDSDDEEWAPERDITQKASLPFLKF